MRGCDWCVGPHDAPAAAGPDARVSVVVSHYEQHDDLARTLAALARQDAPVHEVLVTDDGSAAPPRVPAGVRLLTQPDDGFRVALARNRAAAAATGDVLVFLDADTVPDPHLVGRLTRLPREQPDVLVVGRRRHTVFGDLDPADPLAGAVEHELEEPAWLREGWAATDDLRTGDEASFRYVIGALVACGAAWFARVGGFDERFEGYGGEDWDLAHRWRTAGGRLRHVPDAVAWHHGDHAGGPARRVEPTAQRRTDEAVAIARRLATPPVAWRGLRSAPARVVVTHDEELDDRALVIAVDGLLRDLPQADVVSDRPLWRGVADPRVRPSPGVPAAAAQLRVHLHRGLVADQDAWRDVVAAVAAGATSRVLLRDGRPAVTLTDLRSLRRAHLGLQPATTHEADLPDGLRPADDTPLDAWLGGWA